ncbi:Crp/Fnr family transcriptional regulator [Actinoplanes bogorensis]|uniref:Crp/Fnr family transcriptional regulator n=1 Tax=Paractinoplanes bogorensis TaxID=1610840 RepID=A0ABS5YUW4_9ACTN|nr:Crp/Fnr family transcriptional regulator [Actinoplanes bogorensis]MBU2667163.1 Crp/Fnr family transcriptional regulator [Actinoplanes bogorensis]
MDEWPPGTLLGDCEPGVARRLTTLGTLIHRTGPAVLIRVDDPGDHSYLLLSGVVKVTVPTTAGGTALLAVRVGGELVGELAALDGRPRSATVTSAGPITARVIAAPDLQRLIAADAPARNAIIGSVVSRLRDEISRRADFSGADVPTRVARVLLALAERYGQDGPTGTLIRPALAQPELATLVDASEPTVQRALRGLREAGLLSNGYRSFHIHDIGRLREAAYPPT